MDFWNYFFGNIFLVKINSAFYADFKMAEDTAAFANRVGAILNSSFVSLGMDLGTRLGLFDYMIKVDKPLTSQEIAKDMGFKER